MSIKRAIHVICASIALGGCATHPIDAMRPIGATIAQASTVDMLVATDRAADPRPGVFFSGERGHIMSIDDVVVSIPPDTNRKPGRIQWPHKKMPDPSRDFATVSATPIDRKAAVAWMGRQPDDRRRHLLIFVHGYNTSYASGIYLYAQMLHDSDLKVTPANN